MRKRKIPSSFGPYLWSYDWRNMDREENVHLIVHQVLSYGTLKNIERLLKIYGKERVKREFLKPGEGLYQASILEFIKLLLGVRKKIDEKKYVKNLYGASSRFIR